MTYRSSFSYGTVGRNKKSNFKLVIGGREGRSDILISLLQAYGYYGGPFRSAFVIGY